jgi:type I restriction-modification system DNA methylase subunit
MTGGFDKFANSAAKKKGTAEVDSAFLAEIEGWREALAKNVALRNKSQAGTERSRSVKSEADLNYAVQMTIDRMIFLRICEDRGYESEYQLQELSKRENVYNELKKLFEKADRRYNSGLFHFPAGRRAKDEKGRGRADTFTTGLEIDDKVLKDIIKDLYYPAPYVFALIPADILGQIYEQFLGKVIRLTASGNAKVEEKPEVRKAGGVYYTPTFIVSTIVINTLGKLLLGLTPKEAARLKILDPACGSGTFLLGAYQYLLDWHLNWYLNNDFEKWSKGKNAVLVQSKDSWKLSVEKKKEILLNNIYGVDIDPQAVEVTKLSLLLKVIEDPGQLSYLDERILPDLGRNIQCGNSLIGPDYWDGQLIVEDEERARVNAFDWKAAFPEVFAQGGFDVVVGNPPYVRQESLSEFKEYFRKHYRVFSSTADLYAYFIELALRLTKPNGKFSFIVSSKFVRSGYGEQLRKFIPSNSKIEQFWDFGDLPVFEGATVYPCVFVLEKELDSRKQDENKIIVCNIQTLDFENLDKYVEQNSFEVSQLNLKSGEWQLHPTTHNELLKKIFNSGKSLKEYCGKEPYFGVKTGLNEVFIVPDEKVSFVVKDNKQERSIFLPYLRGRNVHRYYYEHTGENLLFSDGITETSHPNVMAYMKEHRAALEARTDIQGTTKKWYELRPCKYYDLLRKPKIIYASVAQNGNFVLDEEGTFVDKTCYFIPTDDKYLLGLLNSKLLFYYFSHIAVQRRGGYFEYLTIYVSQLPIHPINFSDPAEKAQHDKMVSLVERMLALHKSLKSTHNPQEADRLTREVESVDKAIDGLVYGLYGLSEEEIGIVES